MNSNEDPACEHLAHWTQVLKPVIRECEECMKTGSTWVHLRTCQTCGVTLCCDSSTHKHATKHFEQSGHALVISAERGERWVWCFIHKQFMAY